MLFPDLQLRLPLTSVAATFVPRIHPRGVRGCFGLSETVNYERSTVNRRTALHCAD
jgi:hypothetical protein